MKIVVCVKQVPDTKGGVKFKPDGTLDRAAMLTIMNPDDKAGLEAALRLKDQYGAEVTVVTMGLPKAEQVLREAMASERYLRDMKEYYPLCPSVCRKSSVLLGWKGQRPELYWQQFRFRHDPGSQGTYLKGTRLLRMGQLGILVRHRNASAV